MKKNHLNILWTNDNPLTAEHMVMMYAENAMLREWWDSVTVIIWGATSKLVAENKLIQESIKRVSDTGVHFSACVACAHALGTLEAIDALGLELIGWGQPLTDLIKSEEHLITV